MMRISTELPDKHVPSLISAFIALVGIKEWDRRFRQLAAQAKQNPFFLDAYLQEMYGIELEFQRVLKERSVGRINTNMDAHARHELLAFIATVVRVHENLSQAGQKRLRGMLVGGLHDSVGLTPLQQEMTVAAHLFARGFDVTFSDMETGSGFDFLAVKDGVELEVECKRVGYSLGRKVPRLETISLHKRIRKEVEPYLANLNCGLLIRAFVPDRLTAREDEQEAIAKAIGTTFRTGVVVQSNRCELELHEFQIQGTPFDKVSDYGDVLKLRGFLEREFNVKNREVVFYGVPGKRALAISIESRRPDTLMENLFAELSDSASSQFTKTRPGILCVQFLALTSDQVTELGTTSDKKSPSYLLRKTSEFLSHSNRSHVHSIAFRGRGNLERTAHVHGDILTRSVREQGAAYFVTNSNHPNAKDRRYSIFGTEDSPPPRIVA